MCGEFSRDARCRSLLEWLIYAVEPDHRTKRVGPCIVLRGVHIGRVSPVIELRASAGTNSRSR
ncbi:hypothetical protein EI94DRAFT_1740652 [Lactarius quietus]|nr:hypothetical protein EI94DRAFT_1740652 [Lactarius quietus]